MGVGIMINCLFWNVGRKNLEVAIAELIREHNVHLAFLAECVDVRQVIRRLGVTMPSTPFETPIPSNKRIAVVVRNRLEFWRPRRDLFHGVIGEYAPPVGESFLVCAVHLPSQTRGAEDAEGACRLLAEDIRKVEREHGHARSIVVGDLNLDPFAAPVVEARGLHAVMSRAIARRGSRVVHGEEYEFFYNAMWQALGREEGQPHGTYYYDRGGHLVRFWHAFDQVLVRPGMMDRLPSDGVRILDAVGQQSLLGAGGSPNASKFSDHLPVLFSIEDQ